MHGLFNTLLATFSTDDGRLSFELVVDLAEELLDVLVGEADLSEVLVPAAEDERFQVDSHVLGNNGIFSEDGCDVEVDSREPLLVVEGQVLVEGHVVGLGAEGSALQGHLDVGDHTFLGNEFGAVHSLEEGEGEVSQGLVGVSLDDVHDLGNDGLIRESVDDALESGGTDFSLLFAVSEDGHEYTVDLAGHVLAHDAHGLDGFNTDDHGLTTVGDDLLQGANSHGKSRVGDGFEGQDLLVGVGSLVEVVFHDVHELLLQIMGALVEEVLLLAVADDSTHDGSEAEPSRLAEDGFSTSLLAVGELSNHGGDLFRRVVGLLDGLEELGGSHGGDLVVLDVGQDVLDGVLGSCDGQGILNFQ